MGNREALVGGGCSWIYHMDRPQKPVVHPHGRMNSRQARWTLFRGRFRFSLTYHPGLWNVKPDALFQQFSLDKGGAARLSSLGVVRWQVEQEVQEALQVQPAPEVCPPGRLFVPEPVHSLVLTWRHASRISCHPGVHRSLATFLVAIHGNRCTDLCCRISTLCFHIGHQWDCFDPCPFHHSPGPTSRCTL